MARDDVRKLAIVTTTRKPRAAFGDAPNTAGAQAAGDTAEVLFREIVRRAQEE